MPAPPPDLSVSSLCIQLPPGEPRSGDLGTDIAWGLVGLTVLAQLPADVVDTYMISVMTDVLPGHFGPCTLLPCSNNDGQVEFTVRVVAEGKTVSPCLGLRRKHDVQQKAWQFAINLPIQG